MLAAPHFRDNEVPTVLEALLVVAWADGELQPDEEKSIRSAVSVLFGKQSQLSAAAQRKPELGEVADKVSRLGVPQQLWLLRQCYSLARADRDIALDEILVIKRLAGSLGIPENAWPELLEIFAKYDELELDLSALLEPTPASLNCGIVATLAQKKADSQRS